VAGKLLGRLALLARMGSAAVPVLVLTAGFIDLDLGRLLVALLQAAVLVFALAAVCLLCSVWTRRTTDAMLGCYATIFLVGLGGFTLGAGILLPDWLNPVAITKMVSTANAPVRWVAVGMHLALGLVVGLMCAAVATARLRPAGLAQLEKRPGRRLWAFRPAIGNDPVRWRECYVIGLWMRSVSNGLALAGVFTFSAILAGTALHFLAPGLFKALGAGDLRLAWQRLCLRHVDKMSGELAVLGGALLVLAPLVVVVRCAGCIREEKRRKTWDDLILTPLSLDQIVWSKMWGIVQAAVPCMIVYAVLMVALASLGTRPRCWRPACGFSAPLVAC
jgi:hypothetical protein